MDQPEEQKAGLSSLGDLDRLIHEPGRLMLVSYLYVVDGADFLYLLRETELTRGNLSSHMSKLEAAGYVDVEKSFVDRVPRTIYRLTVKGRAAFNRYRRRLADALDSLPAGELDTLPVDALDTLPTDDS